jgi:hypothetical protein
MPKLKLVASPEEASPFDAAFAELLKARSALCESNFKSETTISAAIDAVRAAEWRLIQTPPSDLCELRQLALTTLETFNQAEFEGYPTDGRHLVMLYRLVMGVIDHSDGAAA